MVASSSKRAAAGWELELERVAVNLFEREYQIRRSRLRLKELAVEELTVTDAISALEAQIVELKDKATQLEQQRAQAAAEKE